MLKCRRVTVLSYVASNQEAEQLQKDFARLLPCDIQARLGKAICWKKRGKGGSVIRPGASMHQSSSMTPERYARSLESIWRFTPSEPPSKCTPGARRAMRPSQKLSLAFWPITQNCEIHRKMLGKALGEECTCLGKEGDLEKLPSRSLEKLLHSWSHQGLEKINP